MALGSPGAGGGGGHLVGPRALELDLLGLSPPSAMSEIPRSSPPHLNEGPIRGPTSFPDEQWTQEAVIACQTGHLPWQRPMTLTVNVPQHSHPHPAQGSSDSTLETSLGGGCVQGCLAGDFPWSPLPSLVPTGNLTGLSPPDTHCVEPGGLRCFPCQDSIPSCLLLFLVKAGF